jgi:hypothetical protein
MVRWKAVREALREPRAAGLMWLVAAAGEFGSAGGGEDRLASSLRMEVLCLRAPLKVVFCRRREVDVSVAVRVHQELQREVV